MRFLFAVFAFLLLIPVCVSAEDVDDRLMAMPAQIVGGDNDALSGASSVLKTIPVDSKVSKDREKAIKKAERAQAKQDKKAEKAQAKQAKKDEKAARTYNGDSSHWHPDCKKEKQFDTETVRELYTSMCLYLKQSLTKHKRQKDIAKVSVVCNVDTCSIRNDKKGNDIIIIDVIAGGLEHEEIGCDDIKYATGMYIDGKCSVVKCDNGYTEQDNKCIKGENKPETETQNAKANSDGAEQSEESGNEESTEPEMSEEERQKLIAEKQQAYDAARAKETSTANKALGAASMAAAGIGGMQLASAISEAKSDEQAEADMRAYLETFRCDYGGGKSYKGGETEIQLPGGNALIEYYGEYMRLANDLKIRKQALGMKPGIESEVVLDASQLGLYDDETRERGEGAFTSIYRALTNLDGADAKKWDEQKSATKTKRNVGIGLTATGVVGGAVGDMIINREKTDTDEKTDKKSDTGSNLKNMVESVADNIGVKDVASQLDEWTTGR